MAWENVCLMLLEKKIKGAFTSQTARGPSDVGSHHRRENSRRAVFGSNVTGTGLRYEHLYFLPLPLMEARIPSACPARDKAPSHRPSGSGGFWNGTRRPDLWGTVRAASHMAASFPRMTSVQVWIQLLPWRALRGCRAPLLLDSLGVLQGVPTAAGSWPASPTSAPASPGSPSFPWRLCHWFLWAPAV